MTNELLYLLQVNLALTLLYGFYITLLRNDTFFIWKRIFLFAAPLAAATLPFCRLDALFPAHKPFIAVLTPQNADIIVSGAEGITVSGAILILIIAGAGLMILRLIVRLGSLIHLRLNASHSSELEKEIMVIDRETGHFSFFGWIFINRNMQNAGDIQEIIIHERVHARQLHSIDILFYEIIAALCWYNPLIAMMKREVKRNLEFIADRTALQQGCNKQSYQYNLLKTSTMNYQFSDITNNFNFNHLKKRIMMMNKQKSTKIRLMKYALILPFISGMAILTNAQEKTGLSVENVAKTQTGDSVTIVFDKDIHDFGTVNEAVGEVSTVFTFENRGNEPLMIKEVKASCGCTTPEWTKEPVPVGGKGYIKATYGAKGRVAPFEKHLTVYSNAKPASIILRIKGTVVN